MYYHALGLGNTELLAPEPPKSISRGTTFHKDTSDMAFIRSMLYYLTERVCQELRRQNAPGFPQGFRDNVGLTVSNDDLVARIYADNPFGPAQGRRGATVIYYAKKDVRNAKLTVDLAAPGFARRGKASKRTFRVSLTKNEAAYKIIGRNR